MPTEACDRPAPTFLRLCAGFVYFYFGFLKFFPDLSPGELLGGQSLMIVSRHTLDAVTALRLLAIVECIVGLSFLFNVGLRWTFFLFLFHQAGTFLPLFVLPELTFKIAPFAPNLEGQYIMKNIVSVAAAWTVMLPVVKEAWRPTLTRLQAWRAPPAPGYVEPPVEVAVQLEGPLVSVHQAAVSSAAAPDTREPVVAGSHASTHKSPLESPLH